jgi:hypothetical protein
MLEYASVIFCDHRKAKSAFAAARVAGWDQRDRLFGLRRNFLNPKSPLPHLNEKPRFL